LALNAWSLPFTVPDLDRPENWSFKKWDWHEAVRLTAVSKRLTRDVQTVLAERPDSCVVLFEGLPRGCFFQTEDGPATREALSDLTARAYWLNDPGPITDPGRLAILSFDSERYHLVKTEWSSRTALLRAMNAVIAGRPHAAVVFASYGEAEDPAAFDRHYVRAAAMLVADGPLAYVRALGVDTVGAAPDLIAGPLATANRPVGIALAAVLRKPLTAGTHLDLADTLLRRGVLPRAGLELRIALALAPERSEARLQLARVMIEMGGDLEAMEELKQVTMAADPATRAEAQRLLAEVELRAAASPSFATPREP
jgi:FimV-like protein